MAIAIALKFLMTVIEIKKAGREIHRGKRKLKKQLDQNFLLHLAI